ncbi:MAG: hypothetical protein A2014_08935 [Spirochaetes bacterium GWF1_49_6]|nr:MAG: hypothetical protein A2014_08935 [Spirochaetes bacterium GWF1_49_6]
MEVRLEGLWALALDENNLGEKEEWFIPEHYPQETVDYRSPAFLFDVPFKDKKRGWLKKEFDFTKHVKTLVYLIFFGVDECKVWLNGEFAGRLYNTAGKQVLEVSKLISDKNTLILKFERIQPETLGVWKYAYVIEDSPVPALSKKMISHTPKWLDQVVLYSIFIRNFSPEGTFNGVTEKLPQLKAMGVNTIWLLPIHPVGLKERKGTLGSPYAIKDYYAVNPEFGTKEDFKRLVDTAHSMDIRVIIDLVINHTSPDSVMKDIDPKFYKHHTEQQNAAWGWTDVLELDYSYAPTRKYITEMMEYWIREFNIDGYRCDVAFLVPLDFWQSAIARIRALKKNIFMLAEADNPELYPVGFDLTYDWNLMLTLRRINRGFYPFYEILEYVQTQYQYYPQYARRMIFLENHDTPRAVETFTPDFLIPFNVLKFILPGIPLIYNGEEVGIKNTPSLFDRDPIDWSIKNSALLEFYKEIIKVKKSYPSLNYHFADGFDFSYDHSSVKIHRFDSEKFLEIVFENPALNSYFVSNGKIRKTFQNVL